MDGRMDGQMDGWINLVNCDKTKRPKEWKMYKQLKMT